MINGFNPESGSVRTLSRLSDQSAHLNSDYHSVHSSISPSRSLTLSNAQTVDTSRHGNGAWCGSREIFDREYNILEMVLALVSERKEARQLATLLLSHYHTFAGVIHSQEGELRNLCGMTAAALGALRTVSAAASHLIRQKVTNQPKISCDQSLVNYLTSTTQHERVCLMKVLFLDMEDRLISDEILARGSIDHLTVYPREVAARCLELDAINIMLVFFHPGSSLSPTPEELTAAIDIAIALRVFKIRVRHCIVFARGMLSLFYHDKILTGR